MTNHDKGRELRRKWQHVTKMIDDHLKRVWRPDEVPKGWLHEALGKVELELRTIEKRLDEEMSKHGQCPERSNEHKWIRNAAGVMVCDDCGFRLSNLA